MARTALAAGARWLGVANLAEALELRAAGVAARIVAPLYAGDDPAEALAAKVEISIPSLAVLAAVRRAAVRTSRTARVHFEIDAGLARGGLRGWQVDAALRVLCADGPAAPLRLASMWCQFSHGDIDGHRLVEREYALLSEYLERARSAGLRPLVHAAASHLTITRTDLYLDLVRVGNALYGLVLQRDFVILAV